jgi:hypothetical protein
MIHLYRGLIAVWFNFFKIKNRQKVIMQCHYTSVIGNT